MIRRDPIERFVDPAVEHTRGGNAIQPAMPNPLRAVLFDLDSTLCHYPLTVQEVIDRALDRAGFGDEPSLVATAALTVSVTVVEWVVDPSVPLTVNV